MLRVARRITAPLTTSFNGNYPSFTNNCFDQGGMLYDQHFS